MTLKNRQIDWYNAERRFIFACLTEKEKNKWMEQINSNITLTKIAEEIQKEVRSKCYSSLAHQKPEQISKASTRSISDPISIAH